MNTDTNLIATKPFVAFYKDRTVVVYPKAHPCRCHRMANLFINRGGTTGCLNCDEREDALPTL